MTAMLTAHWREPFSTMECRPIPAHIAAQGPCGHCGSHNPGRWRIDRKDNQWVCECYWYPERRPQYQMPVPEAEQPKLLVGSPAAPDAENRRAGPSQGAMAAMPDEQEAWWVNEP